MDDDKENQKMASGYSLLAMIGIIVGFGCLVLILAIPVFDLDLNWKSVAKVGFGAGVCYVIGYVGCLSKGVDIGGDED